MRRERKRNRLLGYDYPLSGWYFVTICTGNRMECFGDVVDRNMILSEYGQITKERWLWLGQQYDYINVDEFVVMPNHLHGVLVIIDRFDDISRSSTRRDRSRPVVPRKEGDSGITEYEPRKFLYRPNSREDSPQEKLLAVSEVIKKNIQ